MLKKKLSLIIALAFVLILTACGGSNEGSTADNSNKTVGEQVDYKIVGIDPGAGIMNLTINEVLTQYELDDWKVVESSGAAMTASLAKAYDKQEPIIITGWSPHWMFSKFDLKYLDDPKGAYGGEENINAITRLGLKEDHPNAYLVLDQFEWEAEHMESVMLAIQDGVDPEEAAAQFVSDNEELVSTWTEGVTPVDGDKISLVYVAWDDSISSTNVIGHVLESVGYNVDKIQVDAGPMWASIANGSADASVCAWLPVTHQDYAAEYEGKYEDLGPHMTGTKLGLVVPTYMDIDSIEDLK